MNTDRQFSQRLKESIDELIQKHKISCHELNERQLAEAFRDALICGDFQRNVVVDGDGKFPQQIVYLPAAQAARLNARIIDLEAEIEVLTKRIGILTNALADQGD